MSMRARLVVLSVVALLSGWAVESCDYPDPPKPPPVCATEDSPSCWWQDPDTGTWYWNDADTGKAVNER